jgi:hypothetical protein
MAISSSSSPRQAASVAATSIFFIIIALLVDPRCIEFVEAIGCTLQGEPVPKKHEQESC